MSKPGIIYLFVSPSGRAYAGWHGCDHSEIPRRGTGPLPDKVRYKGSGRLWENVARKHGPALRWVILRRFPEGTPRATTDAAEQRAIRLVRRLWGERCANIRGGGEGMTAEDARALWSDPAYAERTKAGIKAALARPEVKARLSASGKRAWSDPDYASRMKAVMAEVIQRPGMLDRRNAGIKDAFARPSTKAKTLRHLERLHADPGWQERRAAGLASAREAAAAPEVRARANAANSATHKALAQTPERRALFARAAKIGHMKRRARRELAPFVQPPAWSAPGAALWAYLPPSRLALWPGRQK